ncbi:uncharacterized protein LODBEIA_P40500 [Lodderomyces beijingensis]|uniref:NFACT RNA-binding domain-containing protein n=1 Tax=Lodderomyces beijingensis TaxID=1775926 RepID=A0ABP0ZSB0_9ASCO
MVYYFTAKITRKDNDSDSYITTDPPKTQEYKIYMGKDKFENVPLIKHSHPKNIWFHVDNLSSAHIYLQLTKPEILSWKSFDQFQIEEELLSQLCQLTKANSIKGNKLNNVTIIYTPVENLHTDGSMDAGTVEYVNPKLLKRFNVAKKENAVLNKLNKTKTEGSTEEFVKNQQDFANEMANERKLQEREEERLSKQWQEEKKSKNDPYADLFSAENIQSSRNNRRAADWEDEDDFW